jgi:hypothetical protein
VTLCRQGLPSGNSLRSWQRLSDQRRATRLALYDRVMALRSQGGTMKGIGRELSIGHRTVRKFPYWTLSRCPDAAPIPQKAVT